MRTTGRRLRAAFVALAVAALQGCAVPIPRYPPMSAEASLRTIAVRLEQVRTVSGTCDITLADPKGDTVQLDGALAARLPNSFRVRTWKLGHAVFDLTIADGRTWLLLPDDSEFRSRFAGGERLPAERLARAVSLLGPEYFRAATTIGPDRGEDPLIVSGLGPGEAPLVCEIDRATLTPRRFRAAGDDRAAGLLSLDRYKIIGGIAWPTLLRASGADGEVTFRMRETEINTQLPEGAFVPPKRAVEQP